MYTFIVYGVNKVFLFARLKCKLDDIFKQPVHWKEQFINDERWVNYDNDNLHELFLKTFKSDVIGFGLNSLFFN